MGQTLWLGFVLTKRDLAQRYRGTVLGTLWPFLYAAMLLGMFTLVFSLILKVRWSTGGTDSRQSEGALMIFAGLIPYLFLAEILGRSIVCIVSMPNFVKKVRFPLALLPSVVVTSALVIAVVNTVIFILAVWWIWGEVPATVWLLVALYVPLFLLGLGIAFLFSALGVFFRDLSQASPLLAQGLMFLAPVCYPISAVPAGFANVIEWNPLTWFVGAYRDVVLNGVGFSPLTYFYSLGGYAVFAGVSLLFFQRVRRSFADLL